MSEKINDGGPAFPMPRGAAAGKHNDSQQGMSLRDWFAGMAMQGMCAVEDNRLCPRDRREDPSIWRKEIQAGDASLCYIIADAMIAEREEGKQP